MEAKEVSDARAEAATCREEAEMLRQELLQAKEDLAGERMAAQICHGRAAQAHNKIKAALVTAEERVAMLETEKKAIISASQALHARLRSGAEQNQSGGGSSLLEEMHRSTLEKMRAERKHLRAAVEEQSYHLSAWEMHHSQAELAKEALERRTMEVEQSTAAQSVMFEEISRQLNQSHIGYASLQDRYNTLEAEKNRLVEDSSRLLKLLEEQRSVSAAREAAMNQKYNALKRAMTDLESECLSLHARLEVGQTRITGDGGHSVAVAPSKTINTAEVAAAVPGEAPPKAHAETASMPLHRLIHKPG